MSRNQKRIDVEKFSRMWWKYEGGKLTARQDISRDPFGSFEVKFRQSLENGGVVMEIENKAYPTLSRTPINYESCGSCSGVFRGNRRACEESAAERKRAGKKSVTVYHSTRDSENRKGGNLKCYIAIIWKTE